MTTDCSFDSSSQLCPLHKNPLIEELNETKAKSQVLLNGIGMGLKEYGVDRIMKDPAALCIDIATGAALGLALSVLPRPIGIAVSAIAALPVLQLVDRAGLAIGDTGKALNIAQTSPDYATKQIADSLGKVTADTAYMLASGIGAYHLGMRFAEPPPPPPPSAGGLGVRAIPAALPELISQPVKPLPFYQPNLENVRIRLEAGPSLSQVAASCRRI